MLNFSDKFFIKKLNYIRSRKQLNLKKFFYFLNKKIFMSISMLTLFKISFFGLNLKYFIRILLIKHGINLFSSLYLVSKNKLLYFQKKFTKFLVNLNLKKILKKNIKYKLQLKLIQALKQQRKLPSRGQGSKTNAQTSKKRNNIYF